MRSREGRDFLWSHSRDYHSGSWLSVLTSSCPPSSPSSGIQEAGTRLQSQCLSPIILQHSLTQGPSAMGPCPRDASPSSCTLSQSWALSSTIPASKGSFPSCPCAKTLTPRVPSTLSLRKHMSSVPASGPHHPLLCRLVSCHGCAVAPLVLCMSSARSQLWNKRTFTCFS